MRDKNREAEERQDEGGRGGVESREDKSIAAIVLRVVSPGGSAVASEPTRFRR